MRLLIYVLTVLHKFGKLLASICSNIFFCSNPFSGLQLHIFWTIWKCLTADCASWYCGSFYSWFFLLQNISFWRAYITMSSNSLIFFLFGDLAANSNTHVISGFHFPISLHALLSFDSMPYTVNCTLLGSEYLCIPKSISKLCSGMQLNYIWKQFNLFRSCF